MSRKCQGKAVYSDSAGGKSGMKKFVQSKGDYNPADELGTSLQSYYDKFSNRGDA